MVFQDPYGFAASAQDGGERAGEPLAIHKFDNRASASMRCWTPSASARRSGFAIRTNCPAASASAWPSPARMVIEPEVLLLDEPTSALDVSVQAEILKPAEDAAPGNRRHLFHGQPRHRGDHHLCDRIAVMADGRIIEEMTAADGPRRPCPRALYPHLPRSERRLCHCVLTRNCSRSLTCRSSPVTTSHGPRRLGDDRRLAAAGWSLERLSDAFQYAGTISSDAVMIDARRGEVASWGDINRRYNCHSIRKSFLSALIGLRCRRRQH